MFAEVPTAGTAGENLPPLIQKEAH